MQGRALAMTAMHNLLGAQPDPELWAERGYQQVQRPLSHLPLGEGAAAGADLTAAQSLLHSLHSAGIYISQDKAVGYAYVRSPAPAGEVMQAGAVMHVVELAVAAAAAVQQGQQPQQQQQPRPQPQPKSLALQHRLGHAGASYEAAAGPAAPTPAHPAVKREPGSADSDEDRKRRRAEEGILKLSQEPACGAALRTAAAGGVAPAVKQEAQPSVKREQQSCGRGAVQQQQQEEPPPPSQQLLQDQPQPQGQPQPQPQQQQQVQALQGQPPARELGEAFVVYVDVRYDSIYCTLRFQVTERVLAGKLLKAACSKLQLAFDLSKVVFLGPDGCRVHMDKTLAECGVESGD